MKDGFKTTVWCVGMVCATLAVTITTGNITRQPKTPSVLFYEACAWGAEPLHKQKCAELAVKERQP